VCRRAILSGGIPVSGDVALEAPSTTSSWLVPFLLLFLRDGGSYGYELTRRIDDFDFGGMPPGAMYQALWQMENDGMVVSESDGSGRGLSRRWCSIADPGEVYLESWAGSLTRYQEEVNLFFKIYEGPCMNGEGKRANHTAKNRR
jgi:poly-beta-hydroxybutyrate-responsive repressor